MRCRLSLFNKILAQCTEMEGLLEVKTASDDTVEPELCSVRVFNKSVVMKLGVE